VVFGYNYFPTSGDILTFFYAVLMGRITGWEEGLIVGTLPVNQIPDHYLRERKRKDIPIESNGNVKWFDVKGFLPIV
jgi:hypothetical protein